MEALTETNKTNFLIKNGLNWNVEKQAMITEKGINIPNHIAVIRQDNLDVLSVMGKGYSFYQNDELLELLFRASQITGFDVARAGLFNGGKKVYFQMKSDDLVLGDDLIEGYLTAINSFDGTSLLAFGASNITVSCQNFFFSGFKTANKAKHTKNMRSKIETIVRDLEKAKVEETKIFGDIKLLAKSDFDVTAKEQIIRKLFRIKKDVNIYDEDLVSTRTKNKINQFNIDLKTELDNKGENMWGLFSGVTRYTTHSIKAKNGEEKNPNEKMFNFYGTVEQAIFHDLVNLSGIS